MVKNDQTFIYRGRQSLLRGIKICEEKNQELGDLDNGHHATHPDVDFAADQCAIHLLTRHGVKYAVNAQKGKDYYE